MRAPTIPPSAAIRGDRDQLIQRLDIQAVPAQPARGDDATEQEAERDRDAVPGQRDGTKVDLGIDPIVRTAIMCLSVQLGLAALRRLRAGRDAAEARRRACPGSAAMAGVMPRAASHLAVGAQVLTARSACVPVRRGAGRSSARSRRRTPARPTVQRWRGWRNAEADCDRATQRRRLWRASQATGQAG